jgi:hypothetical protein
MDPQMISDFFAVHREDLVERMEAGDPKACAAYRRAWFGCLKDHGTKQGNPGPAVPQPQRDFRAEPDAPTRKQRTGTAAGFKPDPLMLDAARWNGFDPDRVLEIIANYQGGFVLKADPADPKAQARFRDLWADIVNGSAPDLDDTP